MQSSSKKASTIHNELKITRLYYALCSAIAIDITLSLYNTK